MKYQKSNIKNQNAQALLELAIFGSLILFLLSALISYGLKYCFQQEAQLEAFRKALELAMQTDASGIPLGSASYTIVRDRHIPDMANPFGMGQVQSFTASASVTRDGYMDYLPDNYNDLPKMVINFQSKTTTGGLTNNEVAFTTAGMRQETIHVPDDQDDYEDLQNKYNLIYGSVIWPEYDDWEEDMSGEWKDITIVDIVEGEVVDYSSAIRQARLIADRDFCVQKCVEGKASDDDELNCSVSCAYSIAVPWYVQGALYDGLPFGPLTPGSGTYTGSYAGLTPSGGIWTFPNINSLFSIPAAYTGTGTTQPVQAMGLQSDSNQQLITDFQMHKTEDNYGITTTDDIYWNVTTTRRVLYNDHLNKNTGYVGVSPNLNLQIQNYSTTRAEEGTTTWQTNW